MRNIILIPISLAFAILLGCTKDEPVDVRGNYEASYSVVESWVSEEEELTKEYIMTISRSSQAVDLILLSNLGDYGMSVTVEAIVDGNRMTIPHQILPNDYGIIGSGKLDGNVLRFTYQESDYYNYIFNVSVTAIKR